MDTRTATAPEWSHNYPGAVLQLSRSGVVMYSNGVLERESGNAIRELPFVNLVDAASSASKVRRMLEWRGAADAERRQVWELILQRSAGLSDPRPFVCASDDDGETVWFIEQLHDPRTAMLSERLSEINSEVVNAHRELAQQRALLAQAHGELQERSTELERSNAALDEFAHVVSHDLQAPLRAIATFSAWLEKDLSGQIPEQAAEYLGLLRRNVTSLGEMIDGVLRYARAGRGQTELEQVDVEALVRDVAQLLTPPHGAVEIQSGLPVLLTERGPLRQVFLNLISNALKHGSAQHGHIVIGAQPSGKLTEFFVQDDGPGIPVRLQERIWTLFATFPPSEGGDGATGGAGIGLAVVRKLVDARGGRVWVDSDTGHGAVFRFLWPGETIRQSHTPSHTPKLLESADMHNSGE